MTSKIDHTSNDNDELYRRARQYVELGLPIVLLMKNHHPPQGLQQKIAANPRYYIENIELLQQDIGQYNIKHIAILFGQTRAKDDAEPGLTLHDLDTDGEIFDKDGNKKKIIGELKKRTMVIKTRKPWGHLVLWFEHSKHHVPIQSSDCIDQFHALEIKCQSNARADVLPSTHRNDEHFSYYHVGLEKVAVMDGLYDKFVDEDLRYCIQSEKHPYSSMQQVRGESTDTESTVYTKRFYSLSEETIFALTPLAGKYYVEGNHDKFTFQLSGMMWHAGIDIDSAISIITRICQQAGDTKKLRKRIDIIKETYTNGNKGLKVAGATEFIKLIKYETGCTAEEAENVVRRIKFVWRIDAPGPELKQPIIIGLKGRKNSNSKKKGSSDKNYENDYSDNYNDNEPDFPPPSNAEILLRLAERKIPFLFANQFDECYACILVPNRIPLICSGKEGLRIGIDNSDDLVNPNLPANQATMFSTQGYHIENVSIPSSKFKEYLMQIYREDSEFQEERARLAMKQNKDQLLEDEVDKDLLKNNGKNRRKNENNEEPIILHGKIIGTEAVRNIQTLLAYQARTKAPILPTYKRVAPAFSESSFYLNAGAGNVEFTMSSQQSQQQLTKIYYALYDNQNRIIEITKTDWTIKSSSENIIFNNNDNKQCFSQKRPYPLLPIFIKNSEIPQVEPIRNYPINIFDTFMKLTNIKNEDEQLLIKVYIVSLFIPEIPHYMLIPYGTYGAAKSFLFKLIKLLVDPDKPVLLTLPKEKEQFVQQLSHSLVLYYDNIEHVPSWFNSEVCSAVSGGGHKKRKLYTDDDDFVYEYMRCLGFNGINIALTKSDSLSRSILIEMAEIDKQNIEEERYLFYRLSQIKPQLLGL